MRWTDLPADRESADAGASALSRGEWDELRRRLERLPPGHPSRPDGEDGAAEGREAEATASEAQADEGTDPPEPPGRPDLDPERGRPADPGQARERHAGPGDRARPGGHGDLGGLGGREPYRPWFTAGEAPEPWFAADAD